MVLFFFFWGGGGGGGNLRRGKGREFVSAGRAVVSLWPAPFFFFFFFFSFPG